MSAGSATFAAIAVITGITTIGFIFGMLYVRQDINFALEKCAKQHNVYECKVVAVPATQPQEQGR